MKNYRLLFVMMAAVMFAVSCTEDEATVDDLSAKKALAMSETDWSSIDFCGPVRHHELIGGQTILMGSVAVGSDGTNLYVKYQADPGYVITETHLFVGDVDSKQFPTAGKHKNPKIGHFPYKWENHEGSETVVHTIPLSEIKDDCFDVVAHAVVECEDGTCGEETAFGAGRINNEIVFASKSVFKVPDIDENTDREYSYPTAATQGIYYTDSTCRWGSYYGYKIIDLEGFTSTTDTLFTKSGEDLGTISVTIENTDLVFTMEALYDNEIAWPFLFVGELDDLFSYTIDGCADFQTFPFKNVITRIPLSEFSGGTVNSALDLGGQRWGFYFEYCSTCK